MYFMLFHVKYPCFPYSQLNKIHFTIPIFRVYTHGASVGRQCLYAKQ